MLQTNYALVLKIPVEWRKHGWVNSQIDYDAMAPVSTLQRNHFVVCWFVLLHLEDFLRTEKARRVNENSWYVKEERCEPLLL